jgi:predicted phosphodiesterase
MFKKLQRLSGKLIPYLILLCLSCSTGENLQSEEKGGEKFVPDKREDHYIIWALSDIQPKNRKEREHFHIAVNDIRQNFPVLDAAICAGDIVQRKKDSMEDYNWFLNTRKKTGIRHWYEIVGNHDARSLSEYFTFIKKPYFYSVEIGNIRIILLSDEVNNSPTVISREAFNWWKKEVIENQDKNIITVTHAALPESKLAFTCLYRSQILDSKRFIRVLKKYRVDLWFSGHTTTPHIRGYNEKHAPELNNTLFINLSSIRREMGISVSSRLLVLKKNSRDLVIKMRNHDKRKFSSDLEVKFKLRYPFSMKNRAPRIIYPPGLVTGR